ncbi:PREDICTED: uncharacterized protein LOC108373140 [Rhagoletis zephyria]|uniref:uncharacterized protein LOC108373140 n=1 Tax=Rhagoletis zephyria TaxID=28612 RepID=UPI0008115D15|nr:PREDICTED: uncharacterized protein LOC108373140 [Rhagoletis zephyria]
MEEHPEVAKGLGSFSSGKQNNTEMWDKFAGDLNCLGPPMRDGRGWNKLWLDYKLKLKQNIAANKRESVATGGGPFTQLSLSPLEQSVDSLLGLQYDVCPSGSTFGGISRSVKKEASAHIPDTAIEDTFEAAVSENTEGTTGNMEDISRCIQVTPSKKRKLSASAVNEREEERIKFKKCR